MHLVPAAEAGVEPLEDQCEREAEEEAHQRRDARAQRPRRGDDEAAPDVVRNRCRNLQHRDRGAARTGTRLLEVRDGLVRERVRGRRRLVAVRIGGRDGQRLGARVRSHDDLGRQDRGVSLEAQHPRRASGDLPGLHVERDAVQGHLLLRGARSDQERRRGRVGRCRAGLAGLCRRDEPGHAAGDQPAQQDDRPPASRDRQVVPKRHAIVSAGSVSPGQHQASSGEGGWSVAECIRRIESAGALSKTPHHPTLPSPHEWGRGVARTADVLDGSAAAQCCNCPGRWPNANRLLPGVPAQQPRASCRSGDRSEELDVSQAEGPRRR